MRAAIPRGAPHGAPSEARPQKGWQPGVPLPAFRARHVLRFEATRSLEALQQ